MAELTDGKSYFVNDESTASAVQDAFLGALTYQSSISNEDLKFKLVDKRIPVEQKMIDLEFDVDYAVGRNLKLNLFNLTGPGAVKSVQLVGPNSQKIDEIKTENNVAVVSTDLAEVFCQKWPISIHFLNVF